MICEYKLNSISIVLMISSIVVFVDTRKNYPSIKIGEFYYRFFFWKEWDSWSKCTKTCGSGTRSRTRYCLAHKVTVADVKYCDGSFMSRDVCNIEPCTESYQCYSESGNSYYLYDIIGTYHYADRFCCNKKMLLPGEKQITKTLRDGMSHFDQYWIQSGKGSDSCNYVTKSKNATRINCDKLAFIICEKKNSLCPMRNLYWAEWFAWQRCAKTCGTGTQTRNRICMNRRTGQEAMRAFCEGPDSMMRYCNREACPIPYECYSHNGVTLYIYDHSGKNKYAKEFCHKKKFSLPDSTDITMNFKKRMPHDRYWIASLDKKHPNWCFYTDKVLDYVDVQCIDPAYIVCKDKSNKICTLANALCHHCRNSPECNDVKNSLLLSESMEFVNETAFKLGQPCAVCQTKKTLDGLIVARDCSDNVSMCDTRQVLQIPEMKENKTVTVNVECCWKDRCN